MCNDVEMCVKPRKRGRKASLTPGHRYCNFEQHPCRGVDRGRMCRRQVWRFFRGYTIEVFSWENDTYFQKRYPNYYVSFESTRFCRALTCFTLAVSPESHRPLRHVRVPRKEADSIVCLLATRLPRTVRMQRATSKRLEAPRLVDRLGEHGNRGMAAIAATSESQWSPLQPKSQALPTTKHKVPLPRALAGAQHLHR